MSFLKKIFRLGGCSRLYSRDSVDAGIVMEEGEYFRKKTQTAFKAEMLRFKLQHHQFEFEFFFFQKFSIHNYSFIPFDCKIFDL